MGAKETRDTCEYVVQYRKKGTKTWHDSHAKTYSRLPSPRQIEREMIDTACDLVSFRWNKKKGTHIHYLRDDYEVRVIRCEVVTRTAAIAKSITLNKEFLLRGIEKEHR